MYTRVDNNILQACPQWIKQHTHHLCICSFPIWPPPGGSLASRVRGVQCCGTCSEWCHTCPPSCCKGKHQLPQMAHSAWLQVCYVSIMKSVVDDVTEVWSSYLVCHRLESLLYRFWHKHMTTTIVWSVHCMSWPCQSMCMVLVQQHFNQTYITSLCATRTLHYLS